MNKTTQSDIIKTCKVHGPLTIDQVTTHGGYYTQRGYIRVYACKVCSSIHWRKRTPEQRAKYNERQNARRARMRQERGLLKHEEFKADMLAFIETVNKKPFLFSRIEKAAQELIFKYYSNVKSSWWES